MSRSARCIPEPVPFAGPKETSAPASCGMATNTVSTTLYASASSQGATSRTFGTHSPGPSYSPSSQRTFTFCERGGPSSSCGPRGRRGGCTSLRQARGSHRICAPPGRPDDPYGACHLLALNYHKRYDGRGKGNRVSNGRQFGLSLCDVCAPPPSRWRAGAC